MPVTSKLLHFFFFISCNFTPAFLNEFTPLPHFLHFACTCFFLTFLCPAAKSVYVWLIFGGHCLKSRDVCIDFDPYFTPHFQCCVHRRHLGSSFNMPSFDMLCNLAEIKMLFYGRTRLLVIKYGFICHQTIRL